MSVYADVLDLSMKQAEIDNTQAQTKLRLAETGQIIQNAQVTQQSRIIARNLELTRQQAANADAGTTAPAGLSGDQEDINANPELKAIQGDYAKSARDYQYHTQMASALRAQGGDLKLAEKYDDNARQARQDMMTAQLRMLQQRKESLREVSSWANAATEDNWVASRQALNRLTPGWDRGKDVDFDPTDGTVVWGPRTQAVVKAIGESGMTAYQQAEVAHYTASEANRQRELDQQRDEYDSRDRQRQARIRQMRENAERADTKEQRLASKAPKTVSVKPPTVKEPTASEANATAPNLQTELGVSPSDAKVAAYDFLRKRNELKAAGVPTDDAESQAMDYVKKNVQAGADQPQTWWDRMMGSKPKPGQATYKKGGSATPPKSDASAEAPLALPADQKDLEINKVYQTKRGPAKWNGTVFEAQ